TLPVDGRHPDAARRSALGTAQERQVHGVGAVDVRPELDVVPVAELDRVARLGVHDGPHDGGRVEDLDVVAAAQDVGDDDLRLGEVGRARDVADHSPGPDGVERGVQ